MVQVAYIWWISGYADPHLEVDTKLETPELPSLEELDLFDIFK